MSRPKTWMVSVVASVACMTSSVAVGQSVSQPSFSRMPDSPAARLRPIGSASAVDQYRQRPASTSPAILRETGYRNNAFDSASANQQGILEHGSVRQTAMQFALPGGGSTAVGPPVTSPAPNSPNFNAPKRIFTCTVAAGANGRRSRSPSKCQIHSRQGKVTYPSLHRPPLRHCNLGRTTHRLQHLRLVDPFPILTTVRT